jgi:hypothetical protein
MVKRAPRRKRPRKPRDVAMIVDRTEDNEGFQVLRRRDEDCPVEIGTLRPLREGKPIDGEVVSLKPRQEAPFLFDVKVEVESRRGASVGPPQVATEEYRRGWDAIWGARRSNEKLN